MTGNGLIGALGNAGMGWGGVGREGEGTEEAIAAGDDDFLLSAHHWKTGLTWTWKQVCRRALLLLLSTLRLVTWSGRNAGSCSRCLTSPLSAQTQSAEIPYYVD